MKGFFRNKWAASLIALVIVLGVIIGFINASDVKISFVENVVNIIVTPMQKIIANAGNGINNFFGYFSDVDAIKAENKKLKEENAYRL